MVKIKKFYKNKRVLVTGATGFKGAWLCLWLKILGAQVCGIGNNPNSNKKLFYELGLHKIIKINLFDIRDYSKVEKIVKKFKPSIIFHLAAQPLIFASYQKPLDTFDINIRGTLNVLEVIKDLTDLGSII